MYKKIISTVFPAFFCLLCVLSIGSNIAVAELNAGKDDFHLAIQENLIYLRADNINFKDILKALEKKDILRVIISEKVPDRRVSLKLEAIPTNAIMKILNKMSIKNYAVVYDNDISSFVVYIVPEGEDILEFTKGNKLLSEMFFKSHMPKYIKGLEIVSTTSGKNGVPISYIKDEILLKFNNGVSEQEKKDLLKKHRLLGVVDDSLSKIGYVKVKIPDGREVINLTKELRKEYKIKIPEPNYITNVLNVSDPLYPSQWYVQHANFDKAWEIAESKKAIRVAVIDSGISLKHPDLRGRVLNGYDFVNDDNNADDDQGHGTFVAGILSAIPNSIGIKGLHESALLVPVKVIDKEGYGTYEDTAKGIIYAADSGAKVINLSIGGYAYSYILQDAVDYALSKGCIVVSAGGNDGIEQEIYPAAYPDVIGVTALDYDSKIWSRSNIGNHVDIAAPGVDIISTGLSDSYVYATGTSAATPIVSALAATIASENPDLSSSAIQNLIFQSAQDLGEKGWDKIFGKGQIDAAAALDQKIKSFHDLVVRGVYIEQMIFEKGKSTNIIAVIENVGTFKSEKCDVILYEIVGEERKEIGRKENLVVFNKTKVIFEWIPDKIIENVSFEVTILPVTDEIMLNNTKLTSSFSLKDTNGLYVLYKNMPFVHSWVALQAYNILPPGAVKSDLTNNILYGGATYDQLFGSAHIWEDSYSVPGTWSTDRKSGSSIFEGAWEEDEDWYGLIYSACRHFWDPDISCNYGFDPSGLENAICGFSRNDSALTQAEYWWNLAINNYSNDKSLSYYYLGRVIHLLGDMGVPDHVHNDTHPANAMLVTDKDDYSNYEEYTKLYYRNYNGSGLPKDIDSLPLNLPSYYVPETYDQKLAKLFYNMAQYTQHYDSSNFDGNNQGYGGETINMGISTDRSSRNQAYQAIAYLNEGGDRIDPNTSITMLWRDYDGLCWSYTDRIVYEGPYTTGPCTDTTCYVDISRGYGQIAFSDGLWNKINNSCDTLRVTYTYKDQTKTDSISNPKDNPYYYGVPDHVVDDQANSIFPENIRYVAALYELFWDRTHPISLGEALDNTKLSWTTGGDANWFGQRSIYYYDTDSAQSGDITDNQTSWIETTVAGPSSVAFFWKISSEPEFDQLKFYIDGLEQISISGEIDWQEEIYTIPLGTHLLKWAYSKDATVNVGSDTGWIDKITMTSDEPCIGVTCDNYCPGLATGGYHNCVLRSNGYIYCWGDDENGQTEEYTDGDAIGVSGGFQHTCVLRSNGNVYCYGLNGDGQTTEYVGGDAVGVAAGAYHTCVLRSNGNVYCYGLNGDGQTTEYVGGDAVGVAAGAYHTCVLRSNGNVYCYGRSNYGQDEDYTGGDAVGVAAGAFHTCVLRSNGDVYCYGRSNYGQDEDYTGGDAVGVGCGDFHTCVSQSNGNVYCYGYSLQGQDDDYTNGDGICSIDKPTITITAPDSTATEAGPTMGYFTVSRTGSTTSSLTVYYGTSGTATAGSDYTSLSGSVVIPAGSSSANITVTPINDSEVESDETVIVTLSANAAYTVGTPSSATVAITSDDVDKPTITITAPDSTATEAGLTTGYFTVLRTGSTTSSLTVYYGTSGTATAGSDYTTLPGSIEIPAGSLSANITVTPINDSEVESDETVIVTLSANAAYNVGTPSSATVTIVSDDIDKPTITITAPDSTATEAGPTTGYFTVSRTGSTTSSLTVYYGTSGTATAGSDYTTLPGSIEIPAGSLSANITVTPINDSEVESDETVIVMLSADAAYNVGTSSSATVTIISDDTSGDRYVSTTGNNTGTCTGISSPCRTIQYAVNQTTDGETVKVSQGTYYENVLIYDKSISGLVIQGGWSNDFTDRDNDPSLTVIDADSNNDGTGDSSVISIILTSSDKAADITIQNLKLSNGNRYAGGGVHATVSDGSLILTLRDNIISENTATLEGSGGGAVWIYSSGGSLATTISNNILSSNNASRGGGIYLQTYGGSGNISANITDNRIIHNFASQYGGGISVMGSGTTTVTIINNIIKNNTTNDGGGIYISSQSNAIAEGDLINNVITENIASNEGGGVNLQSYSDAVLEAVFKNNTISNNTAVYGGGCYAKSQTGGTNTVDVTNNIIWGNTASSDGNDVYIYGGYSTVNVSYSDIGEKYIAYSIYNDLGGNLDTNPIFVDPINGDYHLASGSPCIDSGSNSDAPSIDFEGDARPFDGDNDGNSIVDIGADEYTIQCDTLNGWYNAEDIGPGCLNYDDPTAENRVYSLINGVCIPEVIEYKDCDDQDGWYGGGDAGCGVLDDPSSEFRDYYVGSDGNCTYTTENCGTKDCDDLDGWVGGGDTPGCGDDPAASQVDYFVVSNTDTCGSCQIESLDCDSSDACGNICDGNTVKSYKDYFVIPGTGTCAYLFGSEIENCNTKTTYDSDGGRENTIPGYIRDYQNCNEGSCTYTEYADACSNTPVDDILIEYIGDGASWMAMSWECQSYETNYCSGNLLYRDEWQCSGTPGHCNNGSTDTLVEDCNSHDGWQCNGNTREYYDSSCVGSACTSQITSTENCDELDGCVDGQYYDYSCSPAGCIYSILGDCNIHNNGFNAYFDSEQNWIILAYTEYQQSTGKYSVYLMVMDKDGNIIPADSIMGLSENPFLIIDSTATNPYVGLAFDKSTRTAIVTFMLTSGLQMTDFPNIMPSCAPILRIPFPSILFGTVNIGITQSQSRAICNDGGCDLTINNISPPMNPFSIINNTCESTVAPMACCNVVVQFAPQTEGLFEDVIMVSTNGGSAQIDLSGTGQDVIPINYAISGTVIYNTSGFGGVTMTLTGPVNKTTTTAPNGTYSFTGLSNGTYTITPNRLGYIFTPASRTVTINGFNVTGQNFSASIPGW